MESITLFDEFTRRYYYWRLEEAKKEYQFKFVRLAMMNSYHIRRTGEIICNLSATEKALLLPALIKASEPRLTVLTGEYISTKEASLLKKLTLAEQEAELKKKLAVQENGLKTVKKARLKKIIKNTFLERLSPTFYSNLWFDVDLKNGWVIKTFVEVDDSSYYYSHQIYWHEVRVGSPAINLPSWFGLYPGGWVFMEEEDTQRSADMIVGLCEYFIKTSATLVDGLS